MVIIPFCSTTVTIKCETNVLTSVVAEIPREVTLTNYSERFRLLQSSNSNRKSGHAQYTSNLSRTPNPTLYYGAMVSVRNDNSAKEIGLSLVLVKGK